MKTKLPRIAVILLVAVAWVFASNHCAIGALAAAAEEHACCHWNDSAPAPDAMRECCQSLSAPLPAVASAPVTQLFAVHPAWVEMEALPPLAPDVPAAVSFSSHAPPGVVPFAGQVLNRSLLAHAPPVVLA